MNVTTFFSDKKHNSEKIKNMFGILLKYRPLWVIILNDKQLTDELIEWLKTLNAGFIIYLENSILKKVSKNIVITWKIEDTYLSGFDFIICDNEIKNMRKYLEKWIVPIIIKNNYMSSIFKEFDPLKNEWNVYFYYESNKWSIFYSIVRYLENYKFPFDNKNLVNNILKI